MNIAPAVQVAQVEDPSPVPLPVSRIKTDRRFEEIDFTLPTGGEFEPRPRRLLGEERDARIEKCGQYMALFNPLTGCCDVIRSWCQSKECPTCGERRGKALLERLERARMQSGSISYFHINDAEAKDIIKNLDGKQDYLLCPGEDNISHLFVRTDKLSIAVKGKADSLFIHPAELAALDWLSIQRVPDNRITSGNMGKDAVLPVQEESGIQAQISYVGFKMESATPNDEAFQRAELLTIADTFDFDPRDEAELHLAMAKRQSVFKKYLDKEEIEYEIVHRKRTVNLSLVNWAAGMARLFHKLIKASLITKEQFLKYLSKIDNTRLERMLAHKEMQYAFQLLNISPPV